MDRILAAVLLLCLAVTLEAESGWNICFLYRNTAVTNIHHPLKYFLIFTCKLNPLKIYVKF